MKVPNIGMVEYLGRMKRYALCSDVCYVVALMYIDRVVKKNVGFEITHMNAHR